MASPDAATLFRVPGLVAVITGGATGLGLMMAKALAANGASSVYIIGRRKEKLDAAAAHYPSIIHPVVGDVTSKDSLAAIAAQITKEVGYINLLVCNSGVGGPPMSDVPKDASLMQFKDAVWDKWSMEAFADTYSTNISAVFFTAVAFLELLDEGNKKKNMVDISSQIIITGSIAAYIRVVVSGFAYVSSKAGVTQMAKALSTFLAPHGIRVNTLAPGFFPSEMTEEILARLSGSSDGPPSFPRSFIPAERPGSEEDMFGTCLYLASRAGAYLNGNVIVIDGGRLSVLPSTY